MDGFSIQLGQQVAPVAVAVGVGDGVQHFAQASRGVGIFLAGLDIARVVILPHPGLAQLLVVLPDELVGGVIDIGGCNLCLFAISFISFPNNDILCAKINYMSIFCGYQRTG